MDLKEFIHDLHFDVDKVSPPNREVDWEDAPLPYKVYRRRPVTPLPADIPLSLNGRKTPFYPTLAEIGHLLWYAFGLNSVCQNVIGGEITGFRTSTMQSLRRFVPSGGALYPSELYVYLKPEDAKSGVYHYDTAHHGLTLLREGNYDSYLHRSLGGRCDVAGCFGIAFVSTVFWRNYFKYDRFAYRLQGLDAGALMGQLLEVSKRFHVNTDVYFQFLDDAVNHLLGLATEQESVYAAIALSNDSGTRRPDGPDRNPEFLSAVLCGEVPPLKAQEYVRSKRISVDPLLREMNIRSKIDSSRRFMSAPFPPRSHSVLHAHREDPDVMLPRVKLPQKDFAEVCRGRYSPGQDFVQYPIEVEQVGSLLHEAWQSFMYASDRTGIDSRSCEDVQLYGCLFGVDGIADGAYRYNPQRHALHLICAGDYRRRLQTGMVMDNVNLLTVPLCLHVAGARDHLMSVLGYRGYRIQQMEVGMLVQRILLAASALEMNGHPLLGFDCDLVDSIYDLPSANETALIQIPVGRYRPRPQLEGPLRG